MIIPKRLLKACATSKMDRPELEHVYVDVVERRAWASDGHILVSCPLEEVGEDECSGFVHRSAIEEANRQSRGVRGRLFRGEMVTVVPGGGTWENPTGTFPLDFSKGLIHPYGERVLHVDVALLQRACDVLGNTQVSLWYRDDTSILYLENDRGEQCVVAALELEEAVRKARKRLARHCAEEEL